MTPLNRGRGAEYRRLGASVKEYVKTLFQISIDNVKWRENKCKQALKVK